MTSDYEEIETQENDIRKTIERYLAKNQKATINEIAEATELSWATVKKHLEHLEAIGRVHEESGKNSHLYYINGNGKWQKKVELTGNHTLFLDTFISPFGKPFLRIKETKKTNDRWMVIGEIMITKEKLGEVKKFLEIVEKNIDEYGTGGA
ncbi:Winged helix-turn-helix DNA-binding protein [Candidatus Gugararchaeum adminiculabundum]|nr:Winged helix-turn-helix DNA-binding protein [Candidatus Gugararchaeum adminiculabundum]